MACGARGNVPAAHASRSACGRPTPAVISVAGAAPDRLPCGPMFLSGVPVPQAPRPHRRGLTLAAVTAAVPDFAIAAVFLSTWLRPDSVQPGLAKTLVLVMLLEFIVVHSAGFMGVALAGTMPAGRKVMAALGLGAFYTLFVGGFALAFKTAWPLWSFWGLTMNRVLGALVHRMDGSGSMDYVVRSWAGGAVFYLLFAFATVLLPVPRLGPTPAVVAGLGLEGGGLWIDEPWRPLAFGTCYFAAVGLAELIGHAGMPAPAAVRGRGAAA